MNVMCGKPANYTEPYHTNNAIQLKNLKEERYMIQFLTSFWVSGAIVLVSNLSIIGNYKC